MVFDYCFFLSWILRIFLSGDLCDRRNRLELPWLDLCFGLLDLFWLYLQGRQVSFSLSCLPFVFCNSFRSNEFLWLQVKELNHYILPEVPAVYLMISWGLHSSISSSHYFWHCMHVHQPSLFLSFFFHLVSSKSDSYATTTFSLTGSHFFPCVSIQHLVHHKFQQLWKFQRSQH